MIEPFGYTNELQGFAAPIEINKNGSVSPGAISYYFAMNT
jgi:hypothetical protein